MTTVIIRPAIYKPGLWFWAVADTADPQEACIWLSTDWSDAAREIGYAVYFRVGDDTYKAIDVGYARSRTKAIRRARKRAAGVDADRARTAQANRADGFEIIEPDTPRRHP